MAFRTTIRPFEPGDAPRAALLLETLLPYEPMTAERLLQYHACAPARIYERWWVLARNRQLLGWASAGLHLWTGGDRVGSFFVGVRPEARRQGHGGRLFDVVTEHLRTLRPIRIETAAYGPAPQTRIFLEHHGLERVRQAQVWALDPRRAKVGDLQARLQRARADGFRLQSLRTFADQPERMHELYSATLRDVPAESTFSEVRFEEFLCYRFRDPMLSPDGSVVVVDGDLPVAYAWLTTDGRGVGFNAMTGTVPSHRHRGLAKLAKIVSIRWAGENGIRFLYTSNDRTNVDMLELNRSLGYEEAGTWETYSRPSA